MVKQRESNTKRWGTLEELLLASAVNRHGTTSWDSVATEIHNRCSSSSLTPQDCRNKFYDLKRRFLHSDPDSSSSLIPLLDHLTKIRLDDLRRDLQRRDVLIASLEMKLKRLEEERDRDRDRTFPHAHADAGPDLDADAKKTNLRPLNPTPSVDDSDDRENRSLNESNSTSEKDDVRHNGVVRENTITESVKNSKNKETGPLRTGDEPEREWSLNGAAAEPEPELERGKDSAVAAGGGGYKRREKERNWGNSKGSQTAAGDSNEAWESVSESKQEGKEGGGAVSKQQSSDVQSSGNLSQRKRCRNRGGTGTSSGEEPEVSPAKTKPSAVKSEPLLKFLEIIRSHRLGSAFERRLRSQESERYKKLIRQHIDLRTIHSRVVKGAYAESIHRFFRDLLLLFNNAIIFFHRSSPENAAALKLRALVLKEVEDRIPKPQSPILVAKSKSKSSKPKHEPDLSSSNPNPTKPSATTTTTSTMVGCRKRDSVAPLSDVGGKKTEKISREVEGKPKVSDSLEIKRYEKGTWKKGVNSKERARSSRTTTTTTSSKNNGREVKHEYGGNELSSHDGMEVRMEKKERVTKKKQGAVRFLKRMKQNSPSEVTDEDGEASEDESLKEEEEDEEEEKRKNQKQNEGKRERVGRNGGGGVRGGKRGVGRPPKKAETAVTVKKQQREEVGGGGKPRKRSRR